MPSTAFTLAAPACGVTAGLCRIISAVRQQFLFIAPERLRVAGLPDMLAKRPLSLIAIDEAHCISQWGHDFRPDYRMLGQYLPRFRPAPVIALTATATPVVQNDIVEQLGLAQTNRFAILLTERSRAGFAISALRSNAPRNGSVPPRRGSARRSCVW